MTRASRSTDSPAAAVGAGAELRIAGLAGVASTAEVQACVESLDRCAPRDWRELAAVIASTDAPGGSRAIGLSGGQGTGKSTLAPLLAAAFEHRGRRTAVLSLDDYYRTRAEREALAREIHPLFATRGVPGTHDAARLRGDLRALFGSARVAVPVFDKGLDERAGERVLEGPFDRVVVEGWCIGARAEDEAALAAPCNALERDEDPHARWRRYANEHLADEYEALWGDLGVLIYLAAPDLGAVRRWRGEQEQALPPERRRDAAAIARFVAHYERITRSMAETLPERAEWVVHLAPDHSIASVVRRIRP